MQRKLALITALATFLASLASTSALADPIPGTYEATSTSAINCNTGSADAPHGLWTNGLVLGGVCGNYYDPDDLTVELAADGMSGTILCKVIRRDVRVLFPTSLPAPSSLWNTP